MTRGENKSLHWVFKEHRESTKMEPNFHLSQAINPLSGQSDSGVNIPVNKKRELLLGPPLVGAPTAIPD